MRTFANSEDPECCISSVSTLFVMVKKRSSDKIQFFKNNNPTPLDLYNGLSQVYCIKPDGKIHYCVSRLNVTPVFCRLFLNGYFN